MAINYRFTVRRGLAADWTSQNPVLLQGELGLELDTGELKMGTGVTAWNDLPYIFADRGVVEVVAGAGISVDATDPKRPIVSADGGGGGAGGRGYSALRLRRLAGYRAPSDYGGNPTTIASVIGRVYFQPFTVERQTTVASLSARVVTGSAGAVVRIGLYGSQSTDDGEGPGALLVETADLPGDVTGEINGAAATVLSPGVTYWTALAVRGAGISMGAFPFANFPAHWFGRPLLVSNFITNHVYESLGGSWATLPAVAAVVQTPGNANVPAVFIFEE